LRHGGPARRALGQIRPPGPRPRAEGPSAGAAAVARSGPHGRQRSQCSLTRRECDGSQVRPHWHGGKRRWPATASWPAWTQEGTPSQVCCMRVAPEMFTMRFCQCTFPGRSILLRRSFGQSRQRYSATDSGGGGDHARSLRLASCRLYLASLFAPAIIAQRHSMVHDGKECRIQERLEARCTAGARTMTRAGPSRSSHWHLH
jgi:hypothetical protein